MYCNVYDALNSFKDLSLPKKTIIKKTIIRLRLKRKKFKDFIKELNSPLQLKLILKKVCEVNERNEKNYGLFSSKLL